MILELVLAGASGVFLGVAGTACYAAKLYGWHAADMAEPDAATWRRGYEAGKAAARGMALHGADYRPADVAEDRLIEPGAPPEHRTWAPRHG